MDAEGMIEKGIRTHTREMEWENEDCTEWVLKDAIRELKGEEGKKGDEGKYLRDFFFENIKPQRKPECVQMRELYINYETGNNGHE